MVLVPLRSVHELHRTEYRVARVDVSRGAALVEGLFVKGL